MATKLPKPPAKEAAAIAARAKAAGRKPKNMQAAVAATYARTQARQRAVPQAGKVSIPKGEAITPVAPEAPPMPKLDSGRGPQMHSFVPPGSERASRMKETAAQRQARIAAELAARRTRMPRPPVKTTGGPS